MSSSQRHVVALAAELEMDAAVDDALPVGALADARVAEQVDRALLEHAGADPVLDVVAAAALEHDRLDARAVEQLGEREAGRAGADDPDLRPHRSNSAAWPWPTPTQSVASP